jgi:hypothetical protein
MTDAPKVFPRVTSVPTKNNPMPCALTIETDHRADGSHDYRVVAVKNSLDYEAGEVLSEEEMKALCADPNWDIVTAQPRARAQVLGG